MLLLDQILVALSIAAPGVLSYRTMRTGGRTPIDVQIRGGEHHFDWWLGVPFFGERP